MSALITGIHHVTATASDARKNIEFYCGILGLRLVKKTVNFDAREVYHFYYGNEVGSPGTILTFFPYSGLTKGRHGNGFLNTTSFSLPMESLDFWIKRLNRFGIAHKDPQERFNEVFIYFEDDDGLGLELVFNAQDQRQPYAPKHIPIEHGIRGFYNVEIWHAASERTASLLTEHLDHVKVAESGNRIRLAAKNEPGNFVDLVAMQDHYKGLPGSGTVHHIAFATPDAASQEEVRKKVSMRMLNPTEVRDRQYFKSIYFREPGGVLFEVATIDEGFTKDEDQENLGQSLKLPPWFEEDRAMIEKKLPPINIDLEEFR